MEFLGKRKGSGIFKPFFTHFHRFHREMGVAENSRPSPKLERAWGHTQAIFLEIL